MKSSSNAADMFRERALKEAIRYGADSWIFVRELLQNSRDAGASTVSIETESEGGRERITVRDDGEGMGFDRARSFLFTLYASGKREDEGQAGRFGVGFWSVLRFRPDTIVIRSRSKRDRAWELELDGQLKNSRWSDCDIQPGTEIVLERSARSDDLEEEVFDAAHRDGRFLLCRDDSTVNLRITVNERLVSEDFLLPTPRVCFSRRGLRGVVSLGSRGQVDLFAYGLRVRTTEVLDDLVQDLNDPGSGTAFTEGLMPRFLLDSEGLDVLLARGDAREDRSLRRIVRIAQAELERLIDAQLNGGRRRSFLGAVSRRARRLLTAARRAIPRLSVAAALVAGIVLAGSVFLPVWEGPDWLSSRIDFSDSRPEPDLPYRDLGERYEGPSVSSIATPGRAIDLSYRPQNRPVLLGSVRLNGLVGTDPDSVPVGYSSGLTISGDQCLEFEVAVASNTGRLRLPLPTGHWVTGGEVSIGGTAVPVAQSPTGDALLEFGGTIRDRVKYRSCPAQQTGPGPVGTWPELPSAIAQRLPRLEDADSLDSVVAGVEEVVRNAVAYDRTAQTIQAYSEARDRGEPLFSCAVRLGVGDCDVQNAILAASLDRIGVPARMAVGYIGTGGRVVPGLHAWVEFLDGTGRWRIADASLRTGVPGGLGDPVAEGSTSQDPGSNRILRELPWPFLVVGGGLLFGGIAWLLTVARGRRTGARRVEAGEVETPRLLQGALERPDAFRSIPSLIEDPLVPEVGGRRISLRQAQAYSVEGDLFCGTGESALVNRAQRRGLRVLDLESDEGRVVAENLGAQDLCLWEKMLEEAEESGPYAVLNHVLDRLGSRWRARATSCPGQSTMVVCADKLGLAKEYGERLVLINSTSSLGRNVDAVGRQRPVAAALMLAEEIASSHTESRSAARRVVRELSLQVLEEDRGA